MMARVSDEKLRELERRWRETGAVEDEAAFLLERVRAGELTQERLELAAYCGHAGARRAVAAPKDPPQALGQLLEDVEASWGQRVAVGVAVAATQAALASCLASGHPEAALPTSLVQVAEEAFSCPCDMHSEAAWTAYKRRSAEFWSATEDQDIQLRSAQSAALACARAAAGRHHAARKAVDEAAATAKAGGVRTAILTYLLTWALASDRAT